MDGIRYDLSGPACGRHCIRNHEVPAMTDLTLTPIIPGKLYAIKASEVARMRAIIKELSTLPARGADGRFVKRGK